MLVFYKEKYGNIKAGTQTVWGYMEGQPPVDIPYSLYREIKDLLIDATYREGYLKHLFGKDFPPIAFKYSELAFLPTKTIDVLATYMCIKPYSKMWPFRRKVLAVKKKIRECH